jgi:uncharacterized protein DUF1501
MLRLMGSRKRLCDGVTRRDLLCLGGLSTLGAGTASLTLAEWLSHRELHAAASASEPHFGQAKACILLFLFGSPPQHETFDPKPDAPAEVQGELKAIPTNVPGVAIGELLPQTAQVMDKMTVVRSMSHPYPVHGVAYAVTGMPTYTPDIEAKPRDPMHWPYVGSVVDYLDRRRPRASREASVPNNIGLPWRFGSKSDLPTLAGPYASFLGSAYDPIWTDFDGSGTRIVPRLTDAQTKQVLDPFGGTTLDGRFRLSETGPLEGLSADRFDVRRLLLRQFDDSRAWLEGHRGIESFSQQQQTAYSLLTTNKVRDALDVQREPAELRQRYGLTLFGQSCLAARRLVEAGTKFVSVFWDPFELFGGSCWDTHANHYPRLKEYLLPVFDQAYPALLRDLDERGLLDETLVLCISEHGRTPKIDSKPLGAARHHWSSVYSAAFAGGGIARGRVVGKSDAQGGYVASTPVSPKDILATTLHLLGVDPHVTVPNQLNQPVVAVGDGQVRAELLG